MAELQQAQRRRRRNRRTIPLIVGVVVIVAVVIVVTGVSSSGGHHNTSTATSTTPASATSATTTATSSPTAAPIKAGKITGATPCPKFDGSSPHIISFAHEPSNCLTAGKTYTATIDTTEGPVTVAFDTTKTPKTANNFIVLALYHYFDGTSIFRTASDIGIIQGGSPHTQDNTDPGPGYTIKDEGSGYTYRAGDLVMARTSAANSGGAQYFFCATSACSGLNSQGNYVVFAHTTSGLPVLQKILKLGNPSDPNGAPTKLVTISKITVHQS